MWSWPGCILFGYQDNKYMKHFVYLHLGFGGGLGPTGLFPEFVGDIGSSVGDIGSSVGDIGSSIGDIGSSRSSKTTSLLCPSKEVGERESSCSIYVSDCVSSSDEAEGKRSGISDISTENDTYIRYSDLLNQQECDITL